MQATIRIAPLSVNRAYHPIIMRGKSRRIALALTPEARLFKAVIAGSVKRHVITCPVEVEIHFTFKTKASDIDNPLKILLDSLQGIWYARDSQIYKLTVVKKIGTPSVWIRCDPMENQPAGCLK